MHSQLTKQKLRLQKLGDKNPSWKGDRASYNAIHMWLRDNFGSAHMCEIKATWHSSKFEWALRKGRSHGHKRENYIQLCTSHHRTYDYTIERREKISQSLKGRKITWKCHYGRNKRGQFIKKIHASAPLS